jgi:uncharacterized membrane protein SirB2
VFRLPVLENTLLFFLRGAEVLFVALVVSSLALWLVKKLFLVSAAPVDVLLTG